MHEDPALRPYDERPKKRNWLHRLSRALSPSRVVRRIRANFWSEILPFLVAFGFFVWAYWANSVMQGQQRQQTTDNAPRPTQR